MAWPNVQSSDTPGVSNYVWDTGTLSWIKLTSTMLSGGGSGGSTAVTIDGGTLTTLTTLTGGTVTVTNAAFGQTSSTVQLGRVILDATTSTGSSVVLGGSTAQVGRVLAENTTATGPTQSLGGSTYQVGRVLAENTTATGPTNVLGASTAAIGRISSATSEIGSMTVLNPTTSVTVTNASTAPSLSTSATNSALGTFNAGTATAEIGRVVVSTAGSVVPVYITSAAVSKISTSPGVLWWISAYTTSTGTVATAQPGVLRLHNTHSASSTGATVVWSAPVAVIATSTGGSLAGNFAGGDMIFEFGPRGMAFSSACSVDVATNSTGTTAITNAKVTAMYTT